MGRGKEGGGQCARPISHLTPTWLSAEWEVPHSCPRDPQPGAEGQPNLKVALGEGSPPASPLCHLCPGHLGLTLGAGLKRVNGIGPAGLGWAGHRALAAPAVGKSEDRSGRPQQTHQLVAHLWSVLHTGWP